MPVERWSRRGNTGAFIRSDPEISTHRHSCIHGAQSSGDFTLLRCGPDSRPYLGEHNRCSSIGLEGMVFICHRSQTICLLGCPSARHDSTSYVQDYVTSRHVRDGPVPFIRQTYLYIPERSIEITDTLYIALPLHDERRHHTFGSRDKSEI